MVFCGAEKNSAAWSAITAATGGMEDVRRFDLLDEAIEWAEDQVIYRHGGFTDVRPLLVAQRAGAARRPDGGGMR